MALQTNELRIGNWVQNVHSKKGVKVLEVLTNSILIKPDEDIFKFIKNYIVPIRGYDAIFLTPEILEKCGFEKYFPSCYFKKYSNQGELILFSTDTPVAIANNFEPNCFYYGFNHIQHIIKYLHQLQNLYYALTNTELEIKL